MRHNTSGNIHLIAPGYKPENNQHYHLAVRVYDRGYSLLAGEPETREILILSSVQLPDADPQELFRQMQETYHKSFQGNYSFKQTLVMNANRKVTLVPEELFISEKRIRYLSSCIDLDSDDQLFSSPIPKIGAQGVFAVDGNIFQEINRMTPHADYYHPVFFMTTLPPPPLYSSSDTEFRIMVLNNQLYIMSFRDNKLAFFNHFHFNQPEELLYYLLKARNQEAKEFHEKTFLTISGDIGQNSELLHLLSPYFDKTGFASTPENIQCHSVFKKTSWHHYTDLLNAIF